jgi:endoglucanase
LLPGVAQAKANLFAADPLNPLALSPAPPASNPLQGAVAYVDWKRSPAAKLVRRWGHKHPKAAAMLRVISTQPDVARYGSWDGKYPGKRIAGYLAEAARVEPGRVPELSTFNLAGHGCHHKSDSPSQERAYHRWITSFASGIGSSQAILFLEEDAVMVTGCLSNHGRQVRLRELNDAINILSRLPRLAIYLDGGAADALKATRTAELLRKAGVAKIQGFFLNSTHFDWTSKEIRYGEEISRMTGGKHFVVNTAENGRGPLRPHNRIRNGNEIVCNPRGRGLGPKPTFNTGYPNVDAFAWIAYPGQSDGACRPGAPKNGVFWPAWALELVRNADFRVR